MDALTGLIDAQVVRGVLGARIAAADDWGWWSPQGPGAAFHAVTSGAVWVAPEGCEPLQLRAGDVLLLPSGRAHALASDPEALARTSPERSDGYTLTGDGTVRMGRGQAHTHILCAHFAHDPTASASFLAALPETVLLRGRGDGGGLAETVRLVGRELTSPGPGSQVVLARLVDVLLVQALRDWLERDDGGSASPLHALRDPVVSTAMAMIDADPGRAWTTTELARATAVSRATLARRFPATLGETPAAYLTRRRLDLSARRLRDTDDPLEQIAQDVGYTSVYAFSRAFRRQRGVPPGRFRSASRTVAAQPNG
ncbi:AraC transcriptional regulator-like protein [Streptomyces albus]|uniref:AraC transcriptional regulator-like protein n=1 Tax=Streptomyces albus (strain ATCC 21838 / DSM 41398 / FERM P-419 / JCM 4703 / NBRC 107858) TaxID=1081613 RepID=A0A0B5F9S5_STRA4|nr:AraC transcriptional regulator-like protein [Streptomyces albus]AOU81527.1 AraC-like transcriptional regulator [Streptomyces albus]AYN37219.1 AraC family transcriptional regulator [Streptomyces albus]